MRLFWKVVDSMFESLYLLQKDTFNRYTYYLSFVMTALTTLNLVVGPGAGWPDFLQPFVKLLLYMTFPVELLGLETFGIFFLLCIILVLLGATSAALATLSRFLGEEGATWKAKLLRTSLGIFATFSDPIMSVFLVPLACRTFGMSESVSCFTSPLSSVTFYSGIVGIVLLTASSFMSALLHVNDPVSHMILTRAHSRLDLLDVFLSAVLTISFRMLEYYPVLIAFEFIIIISFQVTLMAMFQPYFISFTNDVFTGINAGLIWAGYCYLLLSLGGGGLTYQGDGEEMTDSVETISTIAGILFAIGTLPACVVGFFYSRSLRHRAIRKALGQYTEYELAESVPVIQDDDVFPIIEGLYDPNVDVPFWTSLQAALSEVPLRFLEYDRSPRALAIAEHLLKSALLRHPQSTYLRLQYITFLVSYRRNIPLAALRMEEFKAVQWDIDLRFSVLRKRWELERKLQLSSLGNAAADMDTISFEELKHKIRDAKGLRLKAMQLVKQLWSTLNSAARRGESRRRKQSAAGSSFSSFASLRRRMTKRNPNQVHPEQDGTEMAPIAPTAWGPSSTGGASSSSSGGPSVQIMILSEDVFKVTAVLSELHVVEKRADEVYRFLREKAKDSIDVLYDYAKYMRHIKCNRSRAADLEEEADALLEMGEGGPAGDGPAGPNKGHRGSGGSSVSGSETNESSQMSELLSELGASGSKGENLGKGLLEGISLTMRKRMLLAISVLVVACVVAAYALFETGMSRQETVLINLFESGTRRERSLQAALGLRYAHRAAVHGNHSAFTTQISATQALMHVAWKVHGNLTRSYLVEGDDVVAMTFAADVNVTDRFRGSDSIVTSASYDEGLMRLLGRTGIAAAQNESLFHDFSAGAAENFRTLAFAAENAIGVARAMDELTAAIQNVGGTMMIPERIAALALLSAAILLEAVLVLGVFRPGVKVAFKMLTRATNRLRLIPKAAIAAQLSHVSSLADQMAREDEEAEMMEVAAKTNLAESLAANVATSSPRASSPTHRRTASDGNGTDSGGEGSQRASRPSRSRSHSPRGSFSNPSVTTVKREYDGVESSFNTLGNGDGGVASLEAPVTVRRAAHILSKSPSASPRRMSVDASHEGQGVHSAFIETIGGEARKHGTHFLTPEPPNHEVIGRARVERLPSDKLESITSPPRIHQEQQQLRGVNLNVKTGDESPFGLSSPSSQESPHFTRDHHPQGGTTGGVGPVGDPSSPNLHHASQDSAQDDTSARLKRIILIIWSCLGVTSSFWLLLLIFVIFAGQTMQTAAPELNNANRMHVAARAGHIAAMNLALCNKTDSMCGWFFNETTLRCQLASAAGALMNSHFSTLYGGVQGFGSFSAARSFPVVSANDPCSVLTQDPTYFAIAMDGIGVSNRWRHNSLHFFPNCLTYLEEDNSVHVRSRPRLEKYVTPLSSTSCVQYQSGDSRVTGGLFRLIDDFVRRLLALSQDPRLTGAELNYGDMALIRQYDNEIADLHAGIDKTMLYIMEEMLEELDLYNALMTAFFYIGIIAFIAQSIFLSWELDLIFEDNVEITVIMSRLIRSAKDSFGRDWEAPA